MASLRPGFAFLPKAKPNHLGYAKSAELYFKHMCSTEPILALSWFLGTTGVLMPLFLKDNAGKQKVVDGQLRRIQPDQTRTGV
jgi:hypothetical protein|eukprot:COSAG06_NODE_814_length_12157_cov_7.519738_1_plen_83_part_00